MNVEDEKQALLANLAVAREKMRALLTRVDQKHEIYPTWTIKQVVAHITGWDEACSTSLEAFINGAEIELVAARGQDYYNQQTVETRESLSYEQICREYEFTRERFLRVIERLPAERLREPLLFPWGVTGTPWLLITIFSNHEAEHAEEIAALMHLADVSQSGIDGTR